VINSAPQAVVDELGRVDGITAVKVVDLA